MLDHKENFKNKQSLRIINPIKNEIGRTSKVILGKLTGVIQSKSKLNQWKNTKKDLESFVDIDEKPLNKFVQFDIKDLYPSIKEPLLKKALKCAEEYIDIPTDNKAIIEDARKSLLFNKSETWIKKDSGLFDIEMGVFDKAEVRELVGSFLLYKLSEKYKRKILPLYRDDGLAFFMNVSGSASERIKEYFCKLFKEHDVELWTVKRADITVVKILK